MVKWPLENRSDVSRVVVKENRRSVQWWTERTRSSLNALMDGWRKVETTRGAWPSKAGPVARAGWPRRRPGCPPAKRANPCIVGQTRRVDGFRPQDMCANPVYRHLENLPAGGPTQASHGGAASPFVAAASCPRCSPHHLRQPIHHRPHAPRQIAAGGVHQRERHRWRGVLRQHLHQCALRQQVHHAQARHLDDSQPRQAAGDVGFGVVHREGSLHGDGRQGAVHHGLEAAGARAEGVHEMHQPVVAQVLQRLGRAVRAQVGGAGAVDQPRGAQRSRDEAGIHHGAGAQHAVEALAHHVHAAFGAAQFHLQPRVAGQQFGQARHDHVARHAGGHVDAHAPAQAAAPRAPRRRRAGTWTAVHRHRPAGPCSARSRPARPA